jgi:hypothetical protein
MKKYMKSSKIKKVVVKCGDFWMDEYPIDSEIFEDIYVEAATRAVEKRHNLSNFKVSVIIECWEKKDFAKPQKHICYNTYRVLVNAGLHDKAEIMRNNFIKMYGTDLRNESLKGDNGTTNIKQPDSGSIGK